MFLDEERFANLVPPLVAEIPWLELVEDSLVEDSLVKGFHLR